MKRHEMAVNNIKHELDRLLHIRSQMRARCFRQFTCDSDRQSHYDTLLEIGGRIEGLQYALSLLED